ncbi:MAG TPA: HAD-IA family hydrolase [Acidimicrobiales bacterium]|nr:HAD-IA family hydrolase [Acidimicrobiales bacterium]
MIEAAIFDMDGLLVDSEPIWHDVEIDVFGRHGVDLTVERCLETKGMYLGDAVEHWYARYPWSGTTQGEVAAEITEAMARRLEAAVELKPGAVEALDFCRARGAALALASSSPRRLIDAVVGRFGLAEGFGVVHSGEDEVVGKPDPGIFLTTARLLGIRPEHCVVFEDSAAGVLAAKGAGMACVAVPEVDPTAASGLSGAGGGGEALLDVLGRADVVLGSLIELDDKVWARLSALSRP